MEIEVLTTKKKLTKSLLKQMQKPSFEEMINATCLGFITANFNQWSRNLLLKLNNVNEYRIIGTIWWEHDNKTLEYTWFDNEQYISFKSFKSTEERDLFLEKLKEFNETAKHIFI